MINDCLWCGESFARRRSGGSAQRYCNSTCRKACHKAARKWAIAGLEAGFLTAAVFRNALEAACTLVAEAPKDPRLP
jgi:hypothetical protein